ncbi:MAG TPA: MerR family transcriptional regulator [Myxococcota bacterium]|nr:MerR family transcriptional regulator [Myxococcota bacterium]
MSASRFRSPRSRTHGPTQDIPDKLYFKIGEVATLVGVEAHVLRYWEREVPAIRPGKSASNQRRYRRRDVELFREIRCLLYEEKYTLAGARKRLLAGDKPAEAEVEGEEGESAGVAPEIDEAFASIAPPLPSSGLLSAAAAEEEASRLARIERVCVGLRDLIRLAGEGPAASLAE